MLGLMKVCSFMKRILLIIGVLFISWSFAAEPVFCSSPTIANQSECTSTCAAIADAGGYDVSDLTSGYESCEGKVTTKKISIYKIEIGKLDVSNPSRCIIWEGDDLTIEIAGNAASSLASKYPIDVSSCQKGFEYDAFFITMSRYEQFAAESVFPNDASKMVRTTSTYAAKDTDNNNVEANWLDSTSNGFSDNSKFYTLPDAWNSGGGWRANYAYKKISNASSSADLTSQNSVAMYWDFVKDSKKWATDTATRNGFNCKASDSTDCIGESDGYNDRLVIIEAISPTLTLRDGDETLDLEYTQYYSNRNSTNNHVGAEFLWYNNGGTLEYVGVKSTNGFGSLSASNSRSNKGL